MELPLAPPPGVCDGPGALLLALGGPLGWGVCGVGSELGDSVGSGVEGSWVEGSAEGSAVEGCVLGSVGWLDW